MYLWIYINLSVAALNKIGQPSCVVYAFLVGPKRVSGASLLSLLGWGLILHLSAGMTIY